MTREIITVPVQLLETTAVTSLGVRNSFVEKSALEVRWLYCEISGSHGGEYGYD
jgi:hypothetical protein